MTGRGCDGFHGGAIGGKGTDAARDGHMGTWKAHSVRDNAWMGGMGYLFSFLATERERTDANGQGLCECCGELFVREGRREEERNGVDVRLMRWEGRSGREMDGKKESKDDDDEGNRDRTISIKIKIIMQGLRLE